MLKKILQLFKRETITKSTPLKTIRDVDFFDSVKVKDKSGIIYEGWIYEKSKKHLIITCLDENGDYKDFRFTINRDVLNNTQLEQNHITLYLNE